MNYLIIIIILLSITTILFILKRKNQSSVCRVCNQAFNDKLLSSYKNIPMCGKHFKIVSNSTNLTILESVESSPDHPEKGVDLYYKQIELYKNGTICFIQETYSISKNEIITTLDLVEVN